MSAPVSSTPSIIEVRNELGLSGNCSLLTDIGDATVNDCSGGGDLSTPISLLAWAGYYHAAPPATPTGFAVGPGDDASPSEDPQQDSHLYFTVDAQVCASNWDLHESTTGTGGSYSEIASAVDINAGYVYSVGAADTLRHYKIRALADGGTGESGLTSAIAGRTCPQQPQNPSNDNGDASGNCSSMVIVVSWTNGTSPGVRVSSVRYRWRKLPAAFSGADLGPTGVGDTSFSQNVGSVSTDDQFEFQIRYNEESSFSSNASLTVRTTATVSCYI